MKRFLPLLLLFLPFHTSGQSSWTERLYVEGNYHYGYLIPSVKPIEYFITEHIKGYQLNIGLLSNGNKKWQQEYNYPRMGIGFYHSGLGNPDVYGNANALFFYVDRNFFRQNSRFNLSNRLEYGIGYVSKVNDLQSNPYNIAISSHYNVFLSYSLQALVRLTPLLDFKLGLGFSHLSNGRFYEPNKGLNFVTSYAGLQYSLNEPSKCIAPSTPEEKETSKNKFVFTFGAGEKQLYRKRSDRYAVFALSTEYSRRVFRNGYLGLALNTYYDRSLLKELEYREIPSNESDCWRMSLNLSYEIQMGRFSYIFQPGYYLINPYKNIGKMSNRLCLRYAITDHWLTSITVKAHWVSIADFIEWGVGYRL